MPFDKYKHDYDPAVSTHLEGYFPQFAGDKYAKFIMRNAFRIVLDLGNDTNLLSVACYWCVHSFCLQYTT